MSYYRRLEGINFDPESREQKAAPVKPQKAEKKSVSATPTEVKKVDPDKVFSHNIAVCFIGIVLSLSCLASATWAWFRADVSSSTNELQTATFEVAATVTYTDIENTEKSVAEENGVYTLNVNQAYTFTLTPGGNASTGYVKIIIDSKEYFTEQLIPGEANALTFTLVLKAENATEGTTKTISILSCWGTYKEPKENRDFRYNTNAYTYTGVVTPTPAQE